MTTPAIADTAAATGMVATAARITDLDDGGAT